MADPIQPYTPTRQLLFNFVRNSCEAIIKSLLLLLLLLLLSLLLSLLLLLSLQVRPEITINNYISHKKVDIRQRHKMMAEKGNF